MTDHSDGITTKDLNSAQDLLDLLLEIQQSGINLEDVTLNLLQDHGSTPQSKSEAVFFTAGKRGCLELWGYIFNQLS